jgi:hypothetical protein
MSTVTNCCHTEVQLIPKYVPRVVTDALQPAAASLSAVTAQLVGGGGFSNIFTSINSDRVTLNLLQHVHFQGMNATLQKTDFVTSRIL